MRTDTPSKIHLKDYRPPAFLIDTVEMDVALDPTATRVRTKLAIRPNKDATAGQPLTLDGDEVGLVTVAVDGVTLTEKAYVLSSTALTLTAPPSGPFTLTIETKVNPTANTKLMGLYRSSGTYCTQCEAEGFRRITFFPDRPDVMSVYTVRLEAVKAEAPVLLANGNPVASGDLEGGRHFAVWHDPHPKPSYLFAIVGGDLASVTDTFTTASGNRVDLGIYVEHGNSDRCAYAMDALKRSMKWDEEVFDCEYDLDVFNIVAVSDFNMGAMENKGLNIFNDKYVLADPETATDLDYANIEAIIAHEYFHNWTGNRITCRDWFQLCLKEGLTVFRDQEFSSDMRSRAVKRIEDVKRLRSQQFPEDAGPLAHPVRPASYMEINNFYTATVYEKGAEICRMIKTMIGADAFAKGIALYFKRCDNTAATVEDFVKAFEDATGKDLSPVMVWYNQAGTPTLTVTTKRDEDDLILDFVQVTGPTNGQTEKQAVPIPVRLGLVGQTGDEITPSSDETLIGGDTLIVSQDQASIRFKDVPKGAVPSLLRGFSAPVKLLLSLSEEERLHLAQHDGDAFNRWQAIQSISLGALVEAVKSKGAVESSATIAALKSILSDHELDAAFRALALSLPSEADIAREFDANIDPDAILNARQSMKADIGSALGDQLLETFKASNLDRPYVPDAAGSGARSLSNICLTLLATTQDTEAVALVQRHYETSSNMTDRMAALTIATHGLNAAISAPLLGDFYERFARNHLVIDKWFTVQATAPLPGTLEQVKSLTSHSAFSMKTPNRVRSLISAFAMANQSQFNRADGEGYEFVADRILELDAINPQVAARTMTAYRSWRGLEPERQRKAKNAIERISAEKSLSRDVRDLCERTLYAT